MREDPKFIYWLQNLHTLFLQFQLQYYLYIKLHKVYVCSQMVTIVVFLSNTIYVVYFMLGK